MADPRAATASHRRASANSGRAAASRGRAAAATGARYAGVLALLAVGLDHLQQYAEDSYSAIPTIGTLFVLNFASASAIAAAVWPSRSSPAAGSRSPRGRSSVSS